jgi:protein-S-isoprenylcysteine O-methyltransferase Ste14
MKRTVPWRWANVPLPEPYLAALAGGAILHRIAPLRVPVPGMVANGIGWPMLAGGIGIIAWAVSSSARTEVDRPSELITSGAYAISRNPMYLGWSLAMAGIGAITRGGWVLVGTLVGAALLHRQILDEEAALARQFREAYAAYRARVGLVLGRRLDPDDR